MVGVAAFARKWVAGGAQPYPPSLRREDESFVHEKQNTADLYPEERLNTECNASSGLIRMQKVLLCGTKEALLRERVMKLTIMI